MTIAEKEKKNPKEKAIDEIMDEKHLDREQAWKLYKQRQEQKFIEKERTGNKKDKKQKEKTRKEKIKEFERLRNELAKDELGDQLETFLEGSEPTTEEKKEYLSKLRQPDLLEKIKEEFDKDHIGDDKSKLFLFCDCCTSRLRPDYRMSVALTGDTSEGKTNLKDTIFRHLPDEWYLDVTRITASSLEDDIQSVNLIYFGEKGANKQILEQIKQLVEDGMDILKKDVRTDYKEARREKQPRKVGIYSTTGNEDDRELSSRYCVASVHGNKSKYKKVNINTLAISSDIKKEIARYERREKPTWIELSLRLLEDYDIITIPYAPLLEVDSSKSRSQRDLKRFLNLIRVLAWLHQYDRINFSYEGKKILVASPEDFYNAMEIGDEIFSQSLSELEPRLQEVLECYNKLKSTQTTIIEIEEEEKEDLLWVDRSDIQHELGIDSVNTIKNRVKKLCDMNIFTYKYNKAKNHCYIALKKFQKGNSPVNSPVKHLLITYQTKPLYELIKANYLSILKNGLTGALTGDSTGETKNHTNLLLPLNHPPVKKREKTLFDVLKEQFENQLLQKSTKTQKLTGEADRWIKSQDEKPSQYDKIQEIKEYCLKVQSKHDHVSYVALVDNFGEVTISKLIESGQLVKVSGKDCYRWGDS